MSADGREPKIVLGVLVLVILTGALLGSVIMGPGMMGPGMMWPGMMWGYGGTGAQPGPGSWAWGIAMAFGMLLTLAFWVAVIVGVVLLVRWAIGGPSRAVGQVRSEDPREILRRRYAAGEIDQATYQRMRQELEGEAENKPGKAVGVDGSGR